MKNCTHIWNLVFYIKWIAGQCWLIFKEKFWLWLLMKYWWIQKKGLMVNFMTCTELIVGCINSKVINTLYITNWKVHTQECLCSKLRLSFQSEPLRSLISKSKSLSVFKTKISTQKTRFVALHYQDVRSNSELHLEFCRYGIINVWCDEQSMT